MFRNDFGSMRFGKKQFDLDIIVIFILQQWTT